MKQLFKGSLLKENKVVSNIISYYNLATSEEIKEGLTWYTQANIYCKELSNRFGISISQAAGIIAAFSPQSNWSDNKRFALSFLMFPKSIVKNKQQTLKAKSILLLTSEKDIYNTLSVNNKAWKTKAFFLNISNPDVVTNVTIDRHAIAICFQKINKTESLSDNYGKLTLNQYNFFEKCYVKAALKIDILPQDLQAITWLIYRRLRNLRKHEALKDWIPFDNNSESLPF